MRHRRRFPIWVLPITVLVGVVGVIAWVGLHRRTAPPQKPNVILISIDTCRADRLSCYGYERKSTPNLDALAREATLFENVISPVAMTLPAHTSMLTGTNPPYHGVHHNLAYRVRKSNITLAEQLSDHGYDTAAVVGAFVLDPQFGLAQGFHSYDAEMPTHGDTSVKLLDFLNERAASEVNRAAFARLEAHAAAADKPLFLFVHYYDPHDPYEPPKPFATTFAGEPYVGEIAYIDHEIGRLIAKLEALGLYDDALLIVTADHGEALGDHGEVEHGYFVYHSTIKVPLIIKWPGRNKAMRVSDPVGLVDLMPTILSRVGAPLPPELHGMNLADYVDESQVAREPRFLYSESLTATQYGCTSLLGLETAKFKYIQSSKPELYDLSIDHRQINNLIDRYPDEARRLKGRLRALIDEQTRILDDEAMAALDATAIARLESLGYVGGRLDESFDFETDKRAPADFIDVYSRIKRASGHLNRRQFNQAKKLCEQLVGTHSDIPRLHDILGRVAFEQHRLEDAARHYKDLARVDPANAESFNALGNVHIRLHRPDEAVEFYRQAIRVASGVDVAEETLDRALVRFGRVNPVIFQARLNLANVLFHQRKLAQAVDEYRILVDMDPMMEGDAQRRATFATANYKLGLALSQLGRREEAEAALEEALRIKPEDEDASHALRTIRANRPVFLPP